MWIVSMMEWAGKTAIGWAEETAAEWGWVSDEVVERLVWATLGRLSPTPNQECFDIGTLITLSDLTDDNVWQKGMDGKPQKWKVRDAGNLFPRVYKALRKQFEVSSQTDFRQKLDHLATCTRCGNIWRLSQVHDFAHEPGDCEPYRDLFVVITGRHIFPSCTQLEEVPRLIRQWHKGTLPSPPEDDSLVVLQG